MRFPHPLALLAGGIALAASLTWVLPSGSYDRRRDDATGRDVVIPGTWHRVPAAPVGPFQAVVAIPKGMADAAPVIFLVLLVGGAFVVVDRTGALRRLTGALASKLAGRALLVIPVVSLCFAAGGALQNMQEEIIPLVPVLLLLMARLGFDPLVAVASSLGAAAVGAAFSPINPFQVGIAQKLAQLPLLSGWQFRIVFLALALLLWIAFTLRYARRSQESGIANRESGPIPERVDTRSSIIIALVLATFAMFVYGTLKLGWDFDQLAASFFVMGVLAGLIGGLRVQGTASAFADGFASMAYAAALIGFARAIFVVLDQGHIIDTIVHGIFTPLANLPVAVSAMGMMVAHLGVHVPVPSVSGQAVLTLPVLVPLSDLMGLQRQVTVLAYQFGAGLGDMLAPTNGALMAVLAAAGVPYEKWLKHAGGWTLALIGLGAAAILAAIALGLNMKIAPLVIEAPDGARAAVQRTGAQVASWIPAGDVEQFFTATNATIGDKAYKGGVPVCFPQFGAGSLPQHGFARDLPWTPGEQGTDAVSAWAVFGLSDAGPLTSRWPHAFALELRVSVGGPRLEVALEVVNTGSRAWYFTAALHTYFAVDDIARVTVDGLEGLRYLDKTRNATECEQAEAQLRIGSETDRVYLGARSPVVLQDGARSLEIAMTGFQDVVVWNPWAGAEERWPQFGPQDYRRMVCIEAAVVGTPVSLEHGQHWSGSQILTLR